jgi:hypothetical protein
MTLQIFDKAKNFRMVSVATKTNLMGKGNNRLIIEGDGLHIYRQGRPRIWLMETEPIDSNRCL